MPWPGAGADLEYFGGAALWNLDLLGSIPKPLADANISRRIFYKPYCLLGFLIFKKLVIKWFQVCYIQNYSKLQFYENAR